MCSLRTRHADHSELLANANAEEQARASDLVDRVLPVSMRAAGPRDDTGLGIVVSARGDALAGDRRED